MQSRVPGEDVVFKLVTNDTNDRRGGQNADMFRTCVASSASVTDGGSDGGGGYL